MVVCHVEHISNARDTLLCYSLLDIERTFSYLVHWRAGLGARLLF